MSGKASEKKELVSVVASPSHVRLASWRFTVNLTGDFCSMPVIQQSQIIAELKLPLDTRLQLRLNYGHRPSDIRHDFYTLRVPHKVEKVFYYDLLRLGWQDYPLKLSSIMYTTNRNVEFSYIDVWEFEVVPIEPAYLIHLMSIDAYDSNPICVRDTDETQLSLTVHFDDDMSRYANPGSSHTNQLATLLSSGKFADCKVVSKEGSSQDCHKAILSLKSEVIEKAFETKLAEAQNSQIQLDCNDVILNLILPYIYTGNLPTVTTELAIELHRVSHLYQIEELTAYLADQLLLKADQLVTTTNVLEFVVYADQVELTEVKRFCLQLIHQSRYEIVKLPKWKEFHLQHGDLVDELLLW